MNPKPRLSMKTRFFKLASVGRLILLLYLVIPTVLYAGAGELIAEWLNMRGLSPQLIVFIVAMVPIVELRGAVPIGNNLFNLPLWQTLILSIAGNILPILLLLLFLERLVDWLGQIGLFKSFFGWLFKRARSKSGLIARFEFWGLVIFVGIPLPMTGAWTGSVAAVLMGMSYWRALLGIFSGVLVAAVIVTSLALLKWWGALIAGVVLTLALVREAVAAKRGRQAVRGS
ncbi:MAG: COG2426 family protein [bacterium]